MARFKITLRDVIYRQMIVEANDKAGALDAVEKRMEEGDDGTEFDSAEPEIQSVEELPL